MNSILVKRLVIVLVAIPMSLGVGYVLAGIDFSVNENVKAKQPAAVSLAMQADIDPEKTYKVTDVIDGDTLKVKIDGKEITVRMLGIDTPEILDPRKPIQCFGEEASSETKKLLENKEVRLELNPNREKTDKYDRLLAYVYSEDGLFINKYLLENGFAKEYTFDKSYLYQTEFRSIEKQAKSNLKGLWGKCN